MDETLMSYILMDWVTIDRGQWSQIFSTKVPEGKNLGFSIFQGRIKLGTCVTILGFSKSYAQQQITLLNFKGTQKVLTKTIPKIWMFSNQIHAMKMKNKIAEVQ